MNEKWEARFLDVARLVASWSKEERSKVGCVLVDAKKNIVATGYNGFPRGVKDSVARRADRAAKLAITLHAEENALLAAGARAEGCVAFVTHPPCSNCAAKLVQSGVLEVVYLPGSVQFNEKWADSCALGVEILREAGVAVKTA